MGHEIVIQTNIDTLKSSQDVKSGLNNKDFFIKTCTNVRKFHSYRQPITEASLKSQGDQILNLKLYAKSGDLLMM